MSSSDKIKQFYNKYLDFSTFGFLTKEDIETIVTISSSVSEYSVTKDKNYYWAPSNSNITLLIDKSTSDENFHETNLLINFQATPNVNVDDSATVIGEFKVGMNRAKVEWWGNDVRIYLMDAVQSGEGEEDEPANPGDASFDDFLFYIMKNETADWPDALYVRDKVTSYWVGEYKKQQNRKNGSPYWQNGNKYLYASASSSNGQKFWKFKSSLPSETIIVETIDSDSRNNIWVSAILYYNADSSICIQCMA